MFICCTKHDSSIARIFFSCGRESWYIPPYFIDFYPFLVIIILDNIVFPWLPYVAYLIDKLPPTQTLNRADYTIATVENINQTGLTVRQNDWSDHRFFHDRLHTISEMLPTNLLLEGSRFLRWKYYCFLPALNFTRHPVLCLVAGRTEQAMCYSMNETCLPFEMDVLDGMTSLARLRWVIWVTWSKGARIITLDNVTIGDSVPCFDFLQL